MQEKQGASKHYIQPSDYVIFAASSVLHVLNVVANAYIRYMCIMRDTMTHETILISEQTYNISCPSDNIWGAVNLTQCPVDITIPPLSYQLFLEGHVHWFITAVILFVILALFTQVVWNSVVGELTFSDKSRSCLTGLYFVFLKTFLEDNKFSTFLSCS